MNPDDRLGTSTSCARPILGLLENVFVSSGRFMGAASIVRASAATVACSRRCRGSQVSLCSDVLLTRAPLRSREEARRRARARVSSNPSQARQLHTHPLFEAAVGTSEEQQQKERRAGMRSRRQRQRHGNHDHGLKAKRPAVGKSSHPVFEMHFSFSR